MLQKMLLVWKGINTLPRWVTIDAKLCITQYKLLHNILYFNSMLYKFWKVVLSFVVPQCSSYHHFTTLFNKGSDQNQILLEGYQHCTKMKFSVKDFFRKSNQICRKSLIKNPIFCAVQNFAMVRITLWIFVFSQNTGNHGPEQWWVQRKNHLVEIIALL